MIKYFTIFGERCSGTNFLEHALLENFDIEITWDYGWKHWGWVFSDENYKKTDTEDETLFIGIIRDPIEWINSFFRLKHHLPEHLKCDIFNFLNDEFYSVNDLDETEEVMQDRNFNNNNKRYKNIFELRKVKLEFLSKIMPLKVKNYILIRYEDLNEHYEQLLKFIMKKFELKNKCIEFKPILKYKGIREFNYQKKEITLDSDVIEYIKTQLDDKLERSFKYDLD